MSAFGHNQKVGLVVCHPLWKICSSNWESFPQISGWTISKNNWNHQKDYHDTGCFSASPKLDSTKIILIQPPLLNKLPNIPVTPLGCETFPSGKFQGLPPNPLRTYKMSCHPGGGQLASQVMPNWCESGVWLVWFHQVYWWMFLGGYVSFH